MIKDIATNKEYLAISRINLSAVFESPNIEKVLEAVLLNKSKEKVADILVELTRTAGCEALLIQIINRLLSFDLLNSKQYQCQSLFDIVSLLLDKKIPIFFFSTIKKLIRDIRRHNIIE